MHGAYLDMGQRRESVMSPTDTRIRSVPLGIKLLQVLGVMLVLAILLIQVRTFWAATIDDAFISFRYSVHWAEGQGLTFNIGERVEGYSNFLWVAMMAVASRLGLDVVVTSKVVGLFSLLAVAALSLRFLVAIQRTPFPVALALWLLIASNTAYAFLAVGGMETTFYAALVMLLLDRLRVADGRLMIGSAFLLALLALTRPEGILFSVVLLPALWWLARGRERRWMAWWLLVAALYGGFLTWRWFYFGSLVPNTFYAKPSPTTWFGPVGGLVGTWLSLPELGRFLAAAGGALAAGLALLAATGAESRRNLAPAGVMILASLAFQLYVGPDWMNLGRFLAPVWAPFVILVLVGWQRLSRPLANRRRQEGLALWVGLTVLLNLATGSQFWSERQKYPNFVLTSEDMIAASEWIDAHYPEGYDIVCWRIGALGFYSDLTIIDDRWGLIDSYVAQLRHNNQLTDSTRDQYLARRNPELVIEQGVSDVPPPDEITIGGRRYILIRRFPQGSEEWWDLYQRADLPSPRPE
jgi:arabinofuranosyltransferase